LRALATLASSGADQIALELSQAAKDRQHALGESANGPEGIASSLNGGDTLSFGGFVSPRHSGVPLA
jgi:hypothetical protein